MTRQLMLLGDVVGVWVPSPVVKQNPQIKQTLEGGPSGLWLSYGFLETGSYNHLLSLKLSKMVWNHATSFWLFSLLFYQVAKAGFELWTLLCLPTKCWDYQDVPPCLALMFF